MCGIAGFAGQGDLHDLTAMTARLVHRGPDAEGLWHDAGAGVYLGHRRLSIIDLRDGSQPMWTADRSLGIVFNGEIYNHSELRKELEGLGHRFVTHHSDTEVLLHGYRQWGLDLPKRLNGMWAFAIYDPLRHRIFLSRDRFGKKPLFYSCRGGLFAFASELTALTQHRNVTPTVSTLSLQKYFAYGYIPAPHSLFTEVRKLPGGCSLTVDVTTRECEVRKFWDFVLEPVEKPGRRAEDEWCEELRGLIGRAVKRRLVADVPLGVFLSGGIDSSTIAAFAQKESPGGVKTFSIGFEEESFDESAYSSQVATALGTQHHRELFTLQSARDLIPEVLARLDEPMGDSSLLPTFLLCKGTRRHVTVAVGGDGADELFAGYDPFRALRLARAYGSIVPRPVHQAIRMLAARLPTSHGNMSLDFRVKRTLRGLSYPMPLWNSVWLGPLEPTDLASLFTEPVKIEEVYSEAIECWDACSQSNLVDKTLQFYTRLYLQDDILVKVDRASMMNSLEVRAPFLDIELVDFIRKIPYDFKYRNGTTKYLLKKAVAPLLPSSIIGRAKKGFGIPVGKWLQDGSIAPPARALMGLNTQFVASAVREHRSGQCDQRAFLWNLAVVEPRLSSSSRESGAQ